VLKLSSGIFLWQALLGHLFKLLSELCLGSLQAGHVQDYALSTLTHGPRAEC